MIDRPGRQVPGPFQAFDGRGFDVEVGIVVVVDQVLNFVAIGRQTPVKRAGQPF